MAWSSASLTAAELADFAADHPVLGAQTIPLSPTTKLWSESATGTTSSTDRTLATAPARRAYDGYSHLPTTPNTTAGNSWSYVLDVGAAGITFDFVAILGHNFGTEVYTQVDLEIDNAGNFAAAETIPIITNPTDDRIVNWALYHTGATARRYSDVRYLRLVLTCAGDTDPSMGELILGSRCQLGNAAKYGYGPDDMDSTWDVTEAKSGVRSHVVYSEHAHKLNASWTLYDSTIIANVKSWYKQTGGLFVWCPRPTTSPTTWYHMVLDEYALRMPIVGYGQRELTISAREQGPETYYMEQE